MIYDEYAQHQAKYEAEFGPRTIVLMEVGSFWEIYDDGSRTSFSSCKAVADVLGIQVSRKNKNIAEVSRANHLMAGFPSWALDDKFMPMLLDAGYTVELVSQVTEPPNPKRAVTNIVSKGTYGQEASNWVAAFYFASETSFGASCIDLCTGETVVCEGRDLKVLTKFVDYYRPCESVSFGCENKLNIASSLDMGLAFDKRIEKSVAFQNEVIGQCFNNETMLTSIEYVNLERNPLALVAFVMALVFCKKHNERITTLLQVPSFFGESSKCDLVGNAASQLDLEEVCKLLNNCVTSIGKRRFKQRLYNGLIDPCELEKSWNEVEEAVANNFKEIRTGLQGVYDVEKLYRRCLLRTCTIEQLEMIYSSTKAGFLNAGKIKGVFDGAFSEVPFEFRRGYFEPLDRARDALDHAASLEEAFSSELRSSWPWPFKIERSSENLYFCATAKRWKEAKMPSAASYQILSTSATGLKITHTNLNKAFDARVLAEAKMTNAISGAIDQVCAELAELADEFKELVERIAHVDMINTFALNAFTMGHIRPSIGSCFNARGLRHPIIEGLINVPYVANNVELDRSMLLYGLNAAGKSSLMKAAGIACIMAQSGMFVACHDAFVFRPFKKIFCRINKGDDILNGRSTFMVEMSELRTILKEADADSLVLGDELCAGTEHVSALAIVAAGIETLLERRATFIFTTHLHELADILKASSLNIMHLDVYFDKTLDALIYDRKLKPGQGSRIYGLEVCKSLDLPGDFIERAFKVRNKIQDVAVVPCASSYNAGVFVQNKCSTCGSFVNGKSEIHHIKQQALAIDDRIPGLGHKNIGSNLVTLCDSCHDAVHRGEIEIQGYVASSKGRILLKKERNAISLDRDEILRMGKTMSIAKIHSELGLSRYRIQKILKEGYI